MLSPTQRRAIELRLGGLGVTAIANELGRHRVTLSRWFAGPVVIAELAERMEEVHEQELGRLAGLREKAMSVVAEALSAGDARMAIAALRLPTPTGPALRRGIATDRSAPWGGVDPFHPGPSYTDISPTGRQFFEYRARILLESADEVTDDDAVFRRLLLLGEVAGDALHALELGEGEALDGFGSLSAAEQTKRLAEADRTLDEALEAIVGPDEDAQIEQGMPAWPGEEPVNKAILLLGRALKEMLGALAGAEAALEQELGPEGARIAGWLARAREIAKELTGGPRRRTAAARVQRVNLLTEGFTLLTEGFTYLADALGMGAPLEVDRGSADQAAGDEAQPKEAGRV